MEVVIKVQKSKIIFVSIADGRKAIQNEQQCRRQSKYKDNRSRLGKQVYWNKVNNLKAFGNI